VTFKKRMSDTLGIPIDAEFVEETQENQLVTVDELDLVNSDDATVDSDYVYARKNLRELIERGMSDLEEIANIARSSENPRAFEVMNGILKTMMDANKDLLELAKSKKELKGSTSKDVKTVNNNLIVASTAKIQQMIENLENDESNR